MVIILNYNAKKLSLSCNINLAKKLKVETTTFPDLIYNFLDLKLKELKIYRQEKYALVFIKPSKLQAGEIILYSSNKNRSLKPCFDYRYLN